ncbi:glycosyl hydrolase 115 family protein [Gracilibacillus salinarum]|uniref:Glycosyl hydrolase 115 family protein n=1 Tax=Gracilibacillus salinarum TaxID=2932255 RepID=A0ABY4GM15_9BACI|nr:glycosyl hydrolase 115 family protein [Gracilibacillus salinarum]UOQ85261.1 glycosyl hydrolase 115 family protein [Gracilibacillus salinarum]
MVIPGTDLPKEGIHASLAHEMGLWVSHHHAEPLGAEMFLRAYPGKQASYLTNPDLFEKLWRDAIEKQKDEKILWVLAFRGQGDAPFWTQDPQFDTNEKRGEMISKVIQRQYDMIHSQVENPICTIALYGEIAELYKEGHIYLPDDVIKMWADNGYGKMVSRRQGIENARVPSLPEPNEQGKNGIYYHVTFHDLQASSHLTMLAVHPETVESELKKIANANAMDYLLVNAGNIRPHLYYLDMLRIFWQEGEVRYREVLSCFVKRMFGSKHEEISDLYVRYFQNMIQYDQYEDTKAGEEFYHHPARMIIGHWLQSFGNETSESLTWATGDIPFPDQVDYFYNKSRSMLSNWQEWLEKYKEVETHLHEEDQVRLKDHLFFHANLHYTGSLGLKSLCESYKHFEQNHYPEAFVKATHSLWHYQESLQTLRDAEHDKWRHFYRADWLTNVENTLYNVDTLRRFIRMHGDNPDFFLWYKEYIMPETEKYIYLENTHREPLSDDKLTELLQEKFKLSYEG